MDEENLQFDEGTLLSLSNISEQQYDIPVGRGRCCRFLQNANDLSGAHHSNLSPLSPFEILFFSESINGNQGEAFSLCPVIPK